MVHLQNFEQRSKLYLEDTSIEAGPKKTELKKGYSSKASKKMKV